MSDPEKIKPFKIDPPEPLHFKFKKMCLELYTNMKARGLALIELDVANYEQGIDTLKTASNTKGIDPSEIQPILCKAIEGTALEDIELALLADTLDIDQAVLQHCRDKNTNGNKRTKNTPCLS
ncbi:hypothetical protein [Planktothrix agardhii]|nr:hypothetical protein [Planktothrix agardhii]